MNNILDKTLITGGNGMVGSYIDFGVRLGHDDLDVTNGADCERVISKYKPKAIIHLAAETDLKKCEEDPAHAYLVNAGGTYNLALAAKKIGAKMVYISTDAVFPNSVSPHSLHDEPNPDSVYGHSKYLGELAVKGMSDNCIIARTSWIFGGGRERDKKFVAKFMGELEKPQAQAVNDQFSSPTYAKDLAAALKDLILKNETGTFHIANSGVASRFDMALVMKKILQKETKIEPVSAKIFNIPTYSQSSGGLVGNVELRSWQEALEEYINTDWQD